MSIAHIETIVNGSQNRKAEKMDKGGEMGLLKVNSTETGTLNTHPDIIQANLRRPRRTRSTTILHHHTIPSSIVGIRQRPQHTLIRIHSRKQQRLLLLPVALEILPEWLTLRPKPTHAILCHMHILRLHRRQQRIIDFTIPLPRHQTPSLPTPQVHT